MKQLFKYIKKLIYNTNKDNRSTEQKINEFLDITMQTFGYK